MPRTRFGKGSTTCGKSGVWMGSEGEPGRNVFRSCLEIVHEARAQKYLYTVLMYCYCSVTAWFEVGRRETFCCRI